MKKSFILYTDTLAILDELTDEQSGQLFKKIKEYHSENKPNKSEKTQSVNSVIDLLFIQFKLQFDRDLDKYNTRVEVNRNNGKLGGRPKLKKRTKAKKADNDNDNDNVNDSDNDNDKQTNYILFEMFWDLYDKKEAKESCIKAWNKLENEDHKKIIEVVPDYVAWKSDKKFRPMPATFLNQKRWLDEIPKSKQVKYITHIPEDQNKW